MKKKTKKIELNKTQLTRLINKGVVQALKEVLPEMVVKVYHNSSVDIKATTSGAYEGSFKAYAGTSKEEMDSLYTISRDRAFGFRRECPTTNEAKSGVVRKNSKPAIQEFHVEGGDNARNESQERLHTSA